MCEKQLSAAQDKLDLVLKLKIDPRAKDQSKGYSPGLDTGFVEPSMYRFI